MQRKLPSQPDSLQKPEAFEDTDEGVQDRPSHDNTLGQLHHYPLPTDPHAPPESEIAKDTAAVREAKPK